MKSINVYFVIAILLFIPGCTISKKFEVKPEGYAGIVNSGKFMIMPGTVKGSSSDLIVFVVPIKHASEEEAVRNAIESKRDCVALVDGKYSYTLYLFLPPIALYQKLEVEASCLAIAPSIPK